MPCHEGEVDVSVNDTNLQREDTGDHTQEQQGHGGTNQSNCTLVCTARALHTNKAKHDTAQTVVQYSTVQYRIVQYRIVERDRQYKKKEQYNRRVGEMQGHTAQRNIA